MLPRRDRSVAEAEVRVEVLLADGDRGVAEMYMGVGPKAGWEQVWQA